MISVIALSLLAPMTSQDFQFTAEDKVIKSTTGLQYADVEVGKGTAVRAGYLAFVHYTLRLGDGSEIDSSRKPDRTPFNFLVGAKQVIAGWDEGLLGMMPGGRRKLRIPAELGYGEMGIPDAIPGGATLWFDVEVLAATHPSDFLPTEKSVDQEGVKVFDVMAGTGDGAKRGEKVSMMYSLYAPDGKLIERGQQPLKWTIGDGKLIKGFDAAAIGMKIGAVRKAWVPSELGYGEAGAGPIGPNQPLSFVLERL
ncbi:MAG: FKBP-type peptidyl-prolyl cis-trans isomerase [Armatimonadota bacterium]|nr:FKBP-type peptidyl-prolyl cis-trans isomerase [Armatimonadota bacterium]